MLQPVVESKPAFEAGSGDLESLRAMSLSKLIADHPDSSNKLRNVIANCVRMGELPCATLGDYLDLGPYASTLFTQRVWSFGARSARELDAIVAKVMSGVPWCVAPEISAEEPGGIPQSDLFSNGLVFALGGATLVEAVKDELISTRLANVLRQPEVGNMEVAEFLSPQATARAYLLRIPNCGRKTFHELDRLCRRYALRRVASAESGEAGGPERADLMSALSSRLEQSTLLELEEPQGPEGTDAESLIRWGFEQLKEREIDILTCRFGLAADPLQTLEEVGARLGVTRERVRQIESKALRKLHRLLRSKLSSALDEAADAFWSLFAGDFVASPAGPEFRRSLPGWVRLALEVAGSDPASWIQAHGLAVQNGVLRPGTDLEELRRVATRFHQAAATSVLPVALAGLAPDVDARLLELAVRAETRLCIAEGYLFEHKPRVRLKRAIRSHAILAAAGRAMSLQELGDRYWRRAADDPCSLRDLVIVMEALPHLFIEIEDGAWAALGAGGCSPEECGAGLCPRSDPEVDPATLAGAIRLALLERGPTSLADLYRDGDNIVPAGRSRISIGPIILGRPELFLRILPGVYALHGQLPSADEVCSAPVPFLLNPYQARVYAFARLAGEPWGTFPLWTVGAEFRLCLWARFEADNPLFHSLLKIASIEDWPVGDRIKDEWLRLAAQRARFELPPPRSVRAEPRPPLDRLLAAAIATRDRGSANWLMFNRILGRRIDSVGGRALLGLMLALGALKPPATDGGDEEWRLPHAATEETGRLIDELSAAIARTGELCWNSDIGEGLAARARRAEDWGLGWATSETVEQALSSEAVAVCGTNEDEDDDGLFERLMHEHRRASEHQKRENIAQWLLDE